ncbi:MAG: carbohydrate-binding family 9-like protein, partial [Chloroflexota bacterium]|nr:carbohydrate-binding family 9-like protein [Chloroflexota bacterium]
MTKMVKLTITLAALLPCVVGVARGEPGIACSLVESAPALDGRLDDPAWAKTSTVSLVGIAGKTGVRPSTMFRLCTDGDWLYVAVEASDPAAETLPREKGARDAINWNETVEVFLAPVLDRPLYYHFAVDPSGTLYDNIGQSGATDNNFAWRCAVRVGSHGWTAEMALPLKELGLSAGVAEGDCLAFNVCRTTRQGAPQQCWSPTGSGYHRRNRFGTLVVGMLSVEAGKRMATLESRYKALANRVGAEDPLAEEIKRDLTSLRDQAAAVRDSAGWARFRAGWEHAAKRLRRLA